MPKSSKTRSSESKKKLARSRKNILVVLAILVTFVGVLYAWNSYTPQSTLQIEVEPELSGRTKDLCGGQYQVYPPTVYNWREKPFPLYSSDQRYYAEVVDSKFRRRKGVILYDADTNLELGRYLSSYPSLKVYCWAEDSSGIYVADYKPVYGYGGIFTPSPKTGPVKKLLVP